MKKGDVFLHRSYLADDLKSKLRCRVTAVRRGRVYWRDDDEGVRGEVVQDAGGGSDEGAG